MKKRNECLLVLTALIWGIAFVAQSEGGDAVGPYSFNCVRSLIGAGCLMPVIALLDRLGFSKPPQTREEKKTLLIGGICCGTALCIASNLQQLGINLGTAAGKAGFLTACYILIVPVLGLFFHKKCGWNIWLGVLITVVGLYLLCMNGSFSLQFSDTLLLICAVCFAGHIMVIDHFSPLVDGVRMSCIQFAVAGVLSSIPMLISDVSGAGGFAGWSAQFASWNAWIPILYAGVMSSGVAYTLQIIGQVGVNPTVASMLMSLESVFSVLAGWVLLGQALSARELLGCVLIFAAILLAQLPLPEKS